MKKFTFPAFIVFTIIFQALITETFAQSRYQNTGVTKQINAAAQSEKCGTMEWLNGAFRRYPEYQAQFQVNERRLAEFVNRKIEEQKNNPQARTQSTIYIPVVFHVVLNAAGQAAITDAMIQAQLDTLNRDFAGVNGDSTNIPAEFQAVRGHGNIQFCLAQRTPIDLPTNGIVRVTSNTVSSGPGGSDPVKSTAAGGSDTWDATRFFNIWVCNLPGILGYATFPPGAPGGSGLAEQGVVVLAQSLPGGTAAPYNKGRTLTHEAGHYFNLYHIWGDQNCGNDQVADTPTQSDETFGCPSGNLAAGCGSPNPPGRMYQNFMDYTDDGCMTMFTNGQNVRSEASITLFRASLLTSNGCTPPAPAAGNDSRISAIITPANGLSTGCTSVTPVVTIQNLGTNTLTSATINVRLNGGGPITANWTGSLVQGATQNVTLAPINLPTVGAYTLQVHTTLPNGQVDAVPSNDTATVSFSRVAQSAIPVSHDFETQFLPPGWSVVNPDAGETWGWFAPGAGGSVAAGSIDNYFYNAPGAIDDIRTNVVNTTGLLATDSIWVTFDLAHKNYPGQDDRLQVVVSTDCGATFNVIWEKAGAQLATAGSSTAPYYSPVANDWVNQRASIGQNLFGGGQIIVGFRNVNDWGNVVWIDNINIDLKPRKDLAAQAIVRPNLTECGPFAPSLTVRNNGGETITAFKTGYTVNNGAPVIQTHNITLVPGATTTVTFANITLPTGTNTIRLFCADPVSGNPGVDTETGNDTLTRTVLVPPVLNNLTEGFEGTTFPPANWLRLNPNNDAITWVRASPGRNSGFSAFIDNWTFNTFGRFDMLQTPGINTNGADSLIISFDVAHRPYPGALDRLRVLVSNNCGASFTSVYSKQGDVGPNGLATGAATTGNFVSPQANEWRRERVAVGAPVLGASALIHFENLSDWGNNIFIDNINIVPRFKRDLQVLDVSPLVYCSSPIAPVATVFNNGTEAVTSYSISYTIGTGTPVVTTVNTAIAPGATANVTLNTGTSAVATSSLRVYTHTPVGASGTGDQYLVNDTITKQISVVSTVTAESISEDFEGATFPPSGWGVSNPDVSTTWQKAGTGFNSTGSAQIRNFIYSPADKQVDRLFSPVLNYNAVDSVKLTFDISAAARVYSGIAGNTQVDTLTVMFTRDCGNSFTTIYKRWGVDLQTLPINANYPQTTEFTPGSSNLWRSVLIDLTAQAAPNGPLQVVFQNTANNGNNIYIDNVNLSTRTVPSNLRTDGYVIFPNPFRDIFTVWHWQQPSDLRFIAVYNSSGQMVWRKEFGTNAGKQVEVDLTKNAAGTYIVRMGYTSGKADVEVKVVKY